MDGELTRTVEGMQVAWPLCENMYFLPVSAVCWFQEVTTEEGPGKAEC